MLKLILIIIALFIISGFLRRIIFSSAYNAFNKAAKDFDKKNAQQKKPKQFWSTTKQSKISNNKNNGGEFIDFEEIK